MTTHSADRPAPNLDLLARESAIGSLYVRPEILEAAEEIADLSDVVGIERSSLEWLVRVVLFLDRQEREAPP